MSDGSPAIQKNGKASLAEDPTYQRGVADAQKGYPPREGGKAYLEGYASEYHDLLVRSKESGSVG